MPTPDFFAPSTWPLVRRRAFLLTIWFSGPLYVVLLFCWALSEASWLLAQLVGDWIEGLWRRNADE